MELIIYQHPCWLLEAAELVHGLVNHTPAGAMVGEGPYCIPKDRLRSIQASACSGMDPEDPRVRFYFEREAFCDFESIGFEPYPFYRIIGEQTHLADTDLTQYLGSHTVIAFVGLVSQADIGIYRIHTLFL